MQRGVWGGRAEKTNQVSVVSPWCRGARLLESHMSGECETEVVCKKLQDERSWVEVINRHRGTGRSGSCPVPWLAFVSLFHPSHPFDPAVLTLSRTRQEDTCPVSWSI